MSSCILYKNASKTLFLIDIPRSIEQVQGDPSCKILSSKPLETPYPSCEPKSAKARAKLQEFSLEDLLLQKRVGFALEELRKEYPGPFCLPRAVDEKKTPKQKRKPQETTVISDDQKTSTSIPKDPWDTSRCLYRNIHQTPHPIPPTSSTRTIYLPPHITTLLGPISSTTSLFNSISPSFPLIILDPPWPNRSALRSSTYNTCYNSISIRDLLSSLPLQDHIMDNGIMAIWITNKDVFRDMVLGERGLFEEWGVKLIEEWIWVKVTTRGEPICALDSAWRKPWEVLLVGRKRKLGEIVNVGVEKRVIVGVPDLHSRKPNLKYMFEEVGILPLAQAEDTVVEGGLEIFARNATSGWWSWGDECLKFQSEESWKIVPGSGSGLGEETLDMKMGLEEETLDVEMEEPSNISIPENSIS